jgi:hypothetical protein
MVHGVMREHATRPWITLVGLAVLCTGLASLKPMTIDEAANYYYAAWIARHPGDPFGFEIQWYEQPEPANHILTPPLLVHWWALAVWLLPHEPVIWKLWLLPFSLLFVYSVYVLLARFTPGLERPLLWMTVLSPVFLPSLNLMPDIPAVAVSLLALTVFFRAADSSERPGRAYALALLAGLLSGVAMQTKYTGFLVPAVLLLYAVVCRRLSLGLIAVAVAPLVFVAWEIFTHLRYGESHFLYQVRTSNTALLSKLFLTLPLLTILGGVAPVATLFGLAALDVRRWLVAAAGGVALLGYVLAACIQADYTIQLTANPLFFGPAKPYEAEFTLAYVIYGVMGLGLAATVAVVVGRLVASLKSPVVKEDRETAIKTVPRETLFLVLWLGLEVAGYFALTPFPAARRVMGVVLVITLLTGRLAVHTCREPGRLALVRGIALAGVVLGLIFQGIDILDAYAQKRAVEQAAQWIRAQGGGTVWYAGHWGFQYYAEQAGMKPVVPQETVFHQGDWLVLPETHIDQQKFVVDPDRTELGRWVTVCDWLPLRTVVGYYGGTTPLEPSAGTRLAVEIRRVTATFPATPGRGLHRTTP